MFKLARFLEYDGIEAPIRMEQHATLTESESPYEPLRSMQHLPLPPVTLEHLEDALNQSRIEEDRPIWVCRRWAQGSFNDIYLLRPSDGGSTDELVLRVSAKSALSAFGRTWVHDKIQSESLALRLLNSRNLPVPRLFASCCDLSLYPDCCGEAAPHPRISEAKGTCDVHGQPFVIEEKMDGECNEWLHRNLSDDAKAVLSHEFGRFMVQMTSIPVPQDQGIGSIKRLSPAGGLEIGPFRNLGSPHPKADAPRRMVKGRSPAPSFRDDLSLLRFTVAEALSASQDNPALAGIHELLLFLRPPAQDEACHRLVFSHLDLKTPNILTANGHLTGVIDLEFHAVLPLYLVAQDPSWLQHEGPRDGEHFPLIGADGGGVVLYWERRETSRLYRRDFQQMVKGLEPDFHHALTWGRPIRQLLDWLRGWTDEPYYAEAFTKWRRHVESFGSLAELVADPVISGDALL